MIITSSHLFIANDFATRAVAAELRYRSVFPGAAQARKAHTAECLQSPARTVQISVQALPPRLGHVLWAPPT